MVRRNTRFISSVERDISRVSAASEWDIMFNTRNKSGISKQTCIILFIIQTTVFSSNIKYP